MGGTKREMKLGMFFAPGGHHMAAWRHPDAYPAGFSFESYVKAARTAERGCFDMLFVADVFSLTPSGNRTDSIRFEPITLLSALAMSTSRIGLVGTATTSFNEPYNVARKFASLDHISGGRAGWNIVTSQSSIEALNYNLESHPPHAERYARAREFVDVVRKLWDSFEDDGLVIDKESGAFFDKTRVHHINHKGKYFQVRGPLALPRCPQGNPVLVQAGSSEDGMSLAASVGEAIFTIQRTIEGAKDFYAGIKTKAAASGRDPAHAVVMPGMLPYVGRTRQEAQDKHDKLLSLIHPEAGLANLSKMMDVDLSGADVEKPFPDLDLAKLNQSRAVGIVESARQQGLNIRQTYERLVVSKGHRQVIGTGSDIADVMQEWFEGGACDGFNVMPPMMPNGLDDFVELVVPELQRRGLFRKEYRGTTLRDHLGLPRPEGRRVAD
jgi:FMN-dependent oxidoreductase (nitrilotriacetate monooxygenase family)